MAKYQITYSCGHAGTVELLGKIKERERKIDWYESQAVCPECYKKEMQKINKEKGLQLIVNINPYSTNNPIILYFDGDTMPNKDSIKSLGYRWDDKPIIGMFGILDISKPVKCWSKHISLDDLEIELKKAENIGAKLINNITDMDIITYHEIKQHKDKKQAEQAEKLSQIEKPICPDILSGVKWNGKIYGKKGYYNFYNNGNKVNITDEQAEQIREYLELKAEYNAKVREINNQ